MHQVMDMARCTHEMILGKDDEKNNLVEKAGRGRAGMERFGMAQAPFGSMVAGV